MDLASPALLPGARSSARRRSRAERPAGPFIISASGW
jgi:hypothetical protein